MSLMFDSKTHSGFGTQLWDRFSSVKCSSLKHVRYPLHSRQNLNQAPPLTKLSNH